MIIKYETDVYEKRKGLFGKTELEVTDGFLVERDWDWPTEEDPCAEKTVPWDFVERIEAGPEHDFIHLWGGETITIPRFRLNPSEYESFLSEVKCKLRYRDWKTAAVDQEIDEGAERTVLFERPSSPILNALAERREWFDAHTNWSSCPCCGYPTLGERGRYVICIICGWEDDGSDDPNSYEVEGGPNYEYSLAEARWNFYRYYTMYRPEPHDPWAEALAKDAERVKQVSEAYDAVIREQDPERRRAAWRSAIEGLSILIRGEKKCRFHSERQVVIFSGKSGEYRCWECLGPEKLFGLK